MSNVEPPAGIDKREVKCLKCGDKFWLHIKHICKEKGQTMSDTPRTDAAAINANEFFGRDGLPNQKVVPIKVARTLERALNEARKETPTADAVIWREAHNKVATDRDRWRTMAQELAQFISTEQHHYWTMHERKHASEALSRFNELNQDQPLIKRNYVITEQELIEALKRSDRGEPEPTEPSPTNAKMSRPTLATAIARYATHREGCNMAEDSGYACT